MINTEIIETEILGTVFRDSSLLEDVQRMIRPDMFSLARHRKLYEMICKLNAKKLDATLSNLATYFEEDIIEIGGISYIKQMMGSIASMNALPFTLKRFIELDARRRWAQLLENYKDAAVDPMGKDFEEMLNEFERKALEIRPKSMEKQSRIDDVIDWYEELTRKMNDRKSAFGMMTGYEGLDMLTLGFQRADFFALGARTSMGKSALANELVKRISEKGYQSAMFSLEMNKAQIYNRFTASMARIPLQDLRIGNVPPQKLEEVTSVMNRIKDVYIDDTRGVTAEYITSEMRRLKRQEGLDFVVIDYLQEIIEGSEKNDHSGSALHRICQKLRTAAKECDCFVLGLSQLKQEIDVRQNKRPFISDLSGSASISAVADGIILLYRDEYYNPDTSEPGILEVNMAKQRNGPTGIVKLRYDKIYQTIT